MSSGHWILPFPRHDFPSRHSGPNVSNQVWRYEENSNAGGRATYLTFTDNLCAAPVALGLQAGVPHGDGGARNQCAAERLLPAAADRCLIVATTSNASRSQSVTPGLGPGRTTTGNRFEVNQQHHNGRLCLVMTIPSESASTPHLVDAEPRRLSICQL